MRVATVVERQVSSRVKDVDFGRSQIVVRRGKGDKGRVTMLPASLKWATRIERVHAQHVSDLARARAGWQICPIHVRWT